MRVLVRILSIGFISFNSTVCLSMIEQTPIKRDIFSCLTDLRNESKLERLTPRENLATVKKVFFHMLMAELNENGKKVGIVILPEDLDDKVGTTWAAHGIQEDSKLLVQWTPSSIRTRAVTFPRIGAAPGQVVNVSANTLTLDVQVKDQMVQLKTPTPAGSDLNVGTWVWVRWNPESNQVESIVR